MRLIYARSEDIERTHRVVTNEYLDYVQKLGNATEQHLRRLLSTPPDPRFSADDRQSLRPFRDFWRDIHEFVKPSRDADTLHTPVALIEQLEMLLSKVPGLEKCQLLLCHTPEANYIQFVRSQRREKAEHYAAIVSGAPAFPLKMGFIAIPYSQESCLFQNLLICHETGHYAFEEKGLESKLSTLIEAALDAHFQDLVSDPDSENALSWCRELLWNWAEEVYCDRFAIGIIGPAYSFSYIEFFDVIGATTGSDVNDFADTHPSDSCRFKEHAEELTLGGWWPLLDEYGKHHADLIRQLSAIPEDQYVFVSDERAELDDRVLSAFKKDVKPHIAGLVRDTFQGTETKFRGRADVDCIKAIHRYLCAGIVPASLVIDGQLFMPEPVILINAAYLFYLYSVPELIERIQTAGRERMDAVSERDKWGQAVEQWTMKALEDLRLPGQRAVWPS
jgi:hypothetical protein